MPHHQSQALRHISRRVRKDLEAAAHTPKDFSTRAERMTSLTLFSGKRAHGGYESALSAESVAGYADAVDLADDYVGKGAEEGGSA
jgi:hypothetical protein